MGSGGGLEEAGGVVAESGQGLAGPRLGGWTVAVDDGAEQSERAGCKVTRKSLDAECCPEIEITAIPEGLGDGRAEFGCGQFVEPFEALPIPEAHRRDSLAGVGGEAVWVGEFEDQPLEVCGLFVGAPLGGQAGDHALGCAEELVEVGDLSGLGRDDPTADLWLDVEESIDGKTSDGVAHRRSADVEDAPDSFGRDLVAGSEYAVEEEVFQVGVGPVVQPKPPLAMGRSGFGQIGLEQ